MLVGLYLLTPLLDKLLERVSRGLILGYVFLVIGFTLDILYQRFSYPKFMVLWCFQYLGYYVLGFELSKRAAGNFWSSNWYLVIYFISSIIVAVLTPIFLNQYNSLYFYGYLTPFVAISSISLYLFFTLNKMDQNYLSDLAILTFGIYLVHAFVLTVLNKIFQVLHFNTSIIIEMPLKFIIVFITSFQLCKMAFKAKSLKKFI